jgi:hypothetical protein
MGAGCATNGTGGESDVAFAPLTTGLTIRFDATDFGPLVAMTGFSCSTYAAAQYTPSRKPAQG